MIYVIAFRLLLPMYLIVTSYQLISILADLVFQKKKRKFKRLATRLAISFIWPLALFSKDGRELFVESFEKPCI